VISPSPRGGLYPGRLPPVRAQWLALPAGVKVATVAGPLVVMAVVALLNPRAGLTAAVLLVGMAAASGVYVKNRTDRHNVAVERGDIRSLPDPHFVEMEADRLPQEVLERAAGLGHPAAELGRVLRFDGGWVVRQRNPKDVAVVLGDDGGWARFDPRTVSDEWAVSEYRAGRGRDG
jgi:hypothetical protein